MNYKTRLEKLEMRHVVPEPVVISVVVVAPHPDSENYDPNFPYGKIMTPQELRDYKIVPRLPRRSVDPTR
jgi:hypothetical protein